MAVADVVEEHLHVDCDVVEHDLHRVALGADEVIGGEAPLRIEDRADRAERDRQAVRERRGVRVRPQRLFEHVARDRLAAAADEDLQQRLGLLGSPRGGRHDLFASTNPESAERLDHERHLRVPGDGAQESRRSRATDAHADPLEPLLGARGGGLRGHTAGQSRQRELDRRLAQAAAHLAPDRERLAQAFALGDGVGRAERRELERLGQAEPVAPLARDALRPRGQPRRPLPVAVRERDPPLRAQRPGKIRPAAGDGARGELLRRGRILVHEHLGQLIARGDDALEVAGALGDRQPFLVEGAREHELAPLAVDVTATDQRIADLVRADRAVERDRGLVVRVGLVELPQAPPAQAAVHQRQRLQARTAHRPRPSPSAI